MKKKHNRNSVLIYLLIFIAILLVFVGLWLDQAYQHKIYVQGAVDEYARVQKIPKSVRKRLTVSYDYKSSDWIAYTTIHVKDKPYQIEYWISGDDAQNHRPEVDFEVDHKEGEGWGTLSDKAKKKFKYKSLYEYY